MKTLKLNHAAIWVTIVLSQLIPLGWYAIFADRWPTAHQRITDEYLDSGQSKYSWLFVSQLSREAWSPFTCAGMAVQAPAR